MTRALRTLATTLAALALAPLEAHAVRLWEEPRAGWSATATLGENTSLASPDLRPSDTLTPLAAGGHAGQSRYPEGVAERWLDVGFYAQPQFIYQTGYDNDSVTNFSVAPGVNLRRTRMVVHGQAHPLLQVRMEFGLSDRLELFDTYALVPVRRWLQVQLGQFRVPFSRQELVSGSRLQFTDSALWSGGANASGVRFVPSYDTGLMVWGWVGPRDLVEYYAGVFNGKGPNNPFNLDGFFLYAGRVVLNPLGRPRAFQEGAIGLPREPTVSIGLNAAGQIRQVGLVTLPGATAPVPNRIRAVSLGADVFAAAYGASLYAELYARDTDETDTHAAPSTQSLGWLVQAGYFIPAPVLRDHLEVVARVQRFDPSTCVTRTQGDDCGLRPPASASRAVYRDFMDTLAVTVGLTWYQLGHGFKAQASYTLLNEYRDLAGGAPGSGVVANDLINLQLTGSF